MTTTERPATPGYRQHLDIWFKATKTGKRAYFYSRLAGRALPLGRDDAELWIATGQATEVDGHPFR